MKFMKNLALVVILALASSVFATQKKLPLTLKQYGKQYYLQWTGSFVTLSADTVSFYADTANSYATDPTRLLFDKKTNIDRENVVPGEQIPEKICASFVGRSDADSSATAWDMFYATSKNGTFTQLGASATGAFNGTTVVGTTTSFQIDPGLFFLPKSRITSATDSVVYSRVQFWGCDD